MEYLECLVASERFKTTVFKSTQHFQLLDVQTQISARDLTRLIVLISKFYAFSSFESHSTLLHLLNANNIELIALLERVSNLIKLCQIKW